MSLFSFKFQIEILSLQTDQDRAASILCISRRKGQNIRNFFTIGTPELDRLLVATSTSSNQRLYRLTRTESIFFISQFNWTIWRTTGAHTEEKQCPKHNNWYNRYVCSLRLVCLLCVSGTNLMAKVLSHSTRVQRPDTSYLYLDYSTPTTDDDYNVLISQFCI